MTTGHMTCDEHYVYMYLVILRPTKGEGLRPRCIRDNARLGSKESNAS